MYSYTSATFALRAKCSLSSYYLFPSNGEPHCCHSPCCHFPSNGFFPINPRIISGYLLGQSFMVPSRTLFSGHRRIIRVFSRSRDSEMTELLAVPSRLHALEEQGRKGRRRKVEIKSVEGESGGSRKDGKASNCLSKSDGSRVASSSSTSLRDAELRGAGRRREVGESTVGYGNIKKGTTFDAVDVSEKEVREVQKHVDDSWRGSRYSSKRDVEVDSTKGNENGSRRRSQRVTRTSEIQSEGIKRCSVSANVRKTEKGESSASSAKQNTDRDHPVVRHDVQRSQENPCKISDFRDNSFQNEAYTRGFQETSVREREEKTNLKKNSAHMAHDNRTCFDLHGIEQVRSTRNTQRVNEVSVFHDSDLEKASCADDKKLLEMDVRTSLVRDSDQVFRKKRTQVVLQNPVEIKSKERDEKLATEGYSIRLRRDEGKHIDGRALEHVEARRSVEMLSRVSKVRSSNSDASSLFEGNMGMESTSDHVRSSVPFATNKGTQVEMNEANHDQIEMSKFNSSSSWSLPGSRVDPQEHNALFSFNRDSNLREQCSQVNEQACLQYSAGTKSIKDANEVDVSRGKNRRISSLQENYNSRIENKNETSLAKTSLVLTQEEEMHRSFLTGESSKSSSMQMTSTGSSHGISISQPTYTGPNSHAGSSNMLQTRQQTNDSATKSDKSSTSHVTEFVGKLHKEIVELNESEKAPKFSSGIQIEEQSKRGVQATSSMQVGELNESRYGDGRYIKEGEQLSPSVLGLKGPSDEMWDVRGMSSQETSNVEQPEVNFPTSGAMDLTTTTPTRKTQITRRPSKSMWSYVIDIIRMSWVLQGHSHTSTFEPDKRNSSNESLSSETWFSGHEPDEVTVGNETQDEEKISLLKDSVPVKEQDKLLFKERKNGDRLAKTSSTSVEAEHIEDAAYSIATVEKQLTSEGYGTLPSITGIVESRIRDKAKVLKPSLSYPVTMMKKGFSSSITQATDTEQLESKVRESNDSGLELFTLPSVSTVDSDLPRISEIEEDHLSGSSITNSDLVPFREKLPESGGIKESEIKQRKFQRNKHVPREQFDEWEEAFKLENEQRKLDEFFMKEAILEAWKGADTWEVPVGAVLVQNGKIIARGCNMVEELRDSTAHAEMICIREASNLLRTWRLAETTLYVTLEPCPMCAGAILQARIDTVVWGAPNRLLGADGSWVRLFPGSDGGSSSMDSASQMVGPVHPFHPKIKIRRGVLATECSNVMQQFFKLRRKKDKKLESPPPPSCLPISNRPTKFFTKLHNIFCMMFCL